MPYFKLVTYWVLYPCMAPEYLRVHLKGLTHVRQAVVRGDLSYARDVLTQDAILLPFLASGWNATDTSVRS